MNATPNLLAELRHADHIIKTMLRSMTVQQQARVGAQLETDGVAGEGMARHHERPAVIAAATSAPAADQRRLDIEGYAVDVLTEADRADILLREVFSKLDQAGDALLAAAAINCFATCTARAVVLMREAADDIIAVVEKGGAV